MGKYKGFQRSVSHSLEEFLESLLFGCVHKPFGHNFRASLSLLWWILNQLLVIWNFFNTPYPLAVHMVNEYPLRVSTRIELDLRRKQPMMSWFMAFLSNKVSIPSIGFNDPLLLVPALKCKGEKKHFIQLAPILLFKSFHFEHFPNSP